MDVKQTTDYSQFKFIKGNRETANWMVNKLISSLTQKDLLYANPIIVNEKMEVIDGQHRLKAAKKMGLPVFYVEVSDANIEHVRLLNSNNKAWKLEDFVSSFADLGNKHYKILKELHEQSNLAYSTLGQMFYPLGTHGEAVEKIRSGNFDSQFVELVRHEIELMLAYSKYAEAPVYRNRAFAQAIIKLMALGTKFDEKRMAAKFEEAYNNKPLLKLEDGRGRMRFFMRQLEDVYNYSMKTEEHRTRFF